MSELDGPRPRPKRLVIVMDGTWNSPATPSQRDSGDEVFKPTNPLKTCRAVKDLDDVVATLVVTSQPRDGDEVVVAGRRYIFQEELTDVDGHVHIGRDERKSLENLAYAINLRAHRGRYADSMSLHPAVRARKVPGDPRSLDLVPKPDTDASLTDHRSTADGWRFETKTDLVERVRELGLDPAEGTPQIVYYDVGVGASRQSPGLPNRILRSMDKIFGGARGAGFEANVEDGYHFLSLNYCAGDEIFLFGFSRGASSVRGLARFIDWMGGILPADDSYWIPRYFDAFLAGKSAAATRQGIADHLRQGQLRRGVDAAKAEAKAERLAGTVTPARIRFLGVWDSVLAIGEKREKPHFGPTPPAVVDHARQALAIDERRPDFEPRIWRRREPSRPDQILEQRWFAGVHSNIGGGYVYDGLANIALHWVLDGARQAGLGLDWDFLSNYRQYPQDQLYDSNQPFWKVVQKITFRSHLGVRRIAIDPEAGLTLHHSVLRRLVADIVAQDEGRQHDRLEPYRPANLRQGLAEIPDLEAFCRALPGLDEDFEIPPAIRAWLAGRG